MSGPILECLEVTVFTHQGVFGKNIKLTFRGPSVTLGIFIEFSLTLIEFGGKCYPCALFELKHIMITACEKMIERSL